MTPASTGKFIAARVSVILFSACMIGGFVWYSHVRAQPKSGVAEGEATAQATILPGSKRANVTVTPDDVGRLREDGTIDLDLEAAAGQNGTPTKAEERMILPSSKLGVFRDIAGNSSAASGTGDGKLVPVPVPGNPPIQQAHPMLFSGSKTFAGPVISTGQGGIISMGNGLRETPALQVQVDSHKPPPPSRFMIGGSKSLQTPPLSSEGVMKLAEKGELPPVQLPTASPPPPEWNQNATIFSSSKSGTIFKPTPQPAAPSVPNQPPASKSPLPETKTGTQPQTDTPAPASP